MLRNEANMILAVALILSSLGLFLYSILSVIKIFIERK